MKISCERILFVYILLISQSLFAIELKTIGFDSSKPKFNPDNKERPGLSIEIMNEIEKIDPDIKFVGKNELVSRKQADDKVARGDIDVFFGLYKNPEREKVVLFSNPLYPLHNKLAVRADDSISVSSLEEVKALGDNGVHY